MKKILIICPYPLGKAPSQRFRFEHYIRHLQEAGHSCEIKPFMAENTWEILYLKGKWFKKIHGLIFGLMNRFFLLFSLHKYDFLLVHREESPVGFPFLSFTFAMLSKKPLYYDFDDAVWMSNVSKGNKKVEFLKNYKNPIRLLKWAHTCLGGNTYLNNFASIYCDKTLFLPSVVDLEHSHRGSKKQDKNPVAIGWTGSHSTVKYLKNVESIIKEVLQEKKVEFFLISDQQEENLNFDYTFIKWNKDTEAKDLLNFHIGIMPLPDEEWTKGKCGFKLIQYMSLGIVPVASKVGVNKDIIGNNERGLLCNSKNDWKKTLIQLIENSEMRRNFGAKSKKFIAKNYSVQSQVNKFLLLFAD